MTVTTDEIREIIIFYSDRSPRCQDVVRYVSSAKIPISWISVDTERMRSELARLKTLKIRGVPTLAVVYGIGSNQKAEIFEGEKVLAWLRDRFDLPERKPIQKRISQPQSSHHTSRSPPRSSPRSSPREEEPISSREEPEEERDRTYDQSPETPIEEDPYEEEPPADVQRASKDAKSQKIDKIKALAKEMEEQRRKALNLDEGGNPIRTRNQSQE